MSRALVEVSRWEALGTVLLGAPDDVTDRGVVGAFADRVAFGATFYTSGSSGSYGCVLDLETVAVARNSYNSIRHRYQQLAPSGGTPTAESVAAVVSNAKRTDVPGGPKILVLATDGSPSGCRTVILTGETLGFADPNGWRLAQVDQVELLGAACEQVRAGEEDLDITFPCSVFAPVVK